MTVHAVIKWWEGRARYQDIDTCIVESISNGINFIAHWVEQVEDSAAEEAEGCRTQEEHDWPSGNLVRVGKMFVEIKDLEVIRVNLFLEPVDMLFELIEPSAV